MSLPLYQRVALKRDLPEHNLRRGDVAVLVDYVAHPEATFEAAGETFPVVARGTTGDERQRLYDEHARLYPEFAKYPSQTSRVIPVFVLERRAG